MSNPYTWKAVSRLKEHGREKEKKAGEDIDGAVCKSPKHVPPGWAKRFEFTPAPVPGTKWPAVAVDLAEDEELDYAMTRQITVGATCEEVVQNPPIVTLAVRVGKKKRVSGEVVERKWAFPDGRIVGHLGGYEAAAGR